MNQYFVDLHIHVGISEEGRWIKIPTSKYLTVHRIVVEAATRKGLHMIGIVDALSPSVLNDLEGLVQQQVLLPMAGGGYSYKGQLSLILGAEIETAERDGGLAHTLIYLPDIQIMRAFSQVMSGHIRNIHMSSQNAHMPLAQLVDIASGFEALIVPAHVFTPHKSIYGACTSRLSHILSNRQMSQISAIELGLSADSLMADRIEELSGYTYLTNSDAHSLDKIAREYNLIQMETANYKELATALARRDDRAVVANYGLDPRLGKYHRTICSGCGQSYPGEMVTVCYQCQSKKIIKGVSERIEYIADTAAPCHPEFRAPYFYQIPLQFIPGIGKKMMDKLISTFGSEMNVLHSVPYDRLSAVAGEGIAAEIISARSGTATIAVGGGGTYGRMLKK